MILLKLMKLYVVKQIQSVVADDVFMLKQVVESVTKVKISKGEKGGRGLKW